MPFPVFIPKDDGNWLGTPNPNWLPPRLYGLLGENARGGAPVLGFQPQVRGGLLQPASLIQALQSVLGGGGGVSSYAKTRRKPNVIDITRFGPRVSPRSGGVWYYGLDGGYKPLTIEDLLRRDQ